MPITADLYNVRVRFDEETLEQLKKSAESAERSVPAEIRWIVRDYFANQPNEDAS